MLWLQLTGGEPLIDKLFTAVYQRAFKLGMMLSIPSNGSRLASPTSSSCRPRYRPYRLAISVYGATAEAYDGLTRRPGSVDLALPRVEQRWTGLADDADLALPVLFGQGFHPIYADRLKTWTARQDHEGHRDRGSAVDPERQVVAVTDTDGGRELGYDTASPL